jgi:hypothetical protein
MASEAAKKAARARAKAMVQGKKVKPKLPLGELPKRISKQAAALRENPLTLTGNKYNPKVSKSEAAAAAGNARAFAKAPANKRSSEKLSAKVDPSKKKSPKPVAKASAIGAVAKRFNVTAREARDIARAVGNVAESFVASKNVKTKSQQYYGGKALKASVKDLKKQVKETGKAATTGKKGTPAGKLKYDVDTGAPFGLRKTKERQNFIQ